MNDQLQVIDEPGRSKTALPQQTRHRESWIDRQLTIADRYRVQQLVGRGGMAEVYLSCDTILKRPVAIKILRPERIHEPGMIQRFRQEARAMAGLTHPGIVTILDAGTLATDLSRNSAGRPYIVMEYLNGVTLRKLLCKYPAETRRFDVNEALRVIKAVLNTLAYSHSEGVVHGDVTAANVMITADRDVKLIDFGSSSHLVTDADATMPLALDATMRYVSPERLQGELFDTRADVYSAGCILYELLSGRTPFEGSSPVDLAYQHVYEQPKAPSMYNSNISAALDQVVLRALAKRPDLRHASAEHFRRYLSAAESK